MINRDLIILRIYLFISYMNPRERMRERKNRIIMLQKEKLKLDWQREWPLITKGYQIQQQIDNCYSFQVYKAIDIKTGQMVTIKRIKRFYESIAESYWVLRQIRMLKMLKHPNVIQLKKIIFQRENPQKLSLIQQYYQTDVKKNFNSANILNLDRINRIIYQILLGLRYGKECQILNQQLRPENILININDYTVKLCKFGVDEGSYLQNLEIMKMQSSRENPHSNRHFIDRSLFKFTSAPEIYFFETKYNMAIDIWSVGWIFGGMLIMTTSFHERHCFPGRAYYPLSPPKRSNKQDKIPNQVPIQISDKLYSIFSIIGTPQVDFIDDETIKSFIDSFGYIPRKSFKSIYSIESKQAQDFLLRTLQFNPKMRMSIEQAVNHPLFDDIRKDYEQTEKIRGVPLKFQQGNLTIDQILESIIKESEQLDNLN